MTTINFPQPKGDGRRAPATSAARTKGCRSDLSEAGGALVEIDVGTGDDTQQLV